ncbi:MAG: hypothetical protein JF616_16000 [Fibrobacteres bacterium]|nr:hypothetical protein [Fibrobacterota bacterium]
MGIGAACLSGCDPASGGGDASNLSGCWSVQDTIYIEAGRTRYETGILKLSPHEMDITGNIMWINSTRPEDSVSVRRNGDSLNLTLIEKSVSEAWMLHGAMQDSDHFYVTMYRMMGTGFSFSASRLLQCPDPNVPNPNPQKLQMQATPDSIGVSHIDSIGLNAFASYAYFGDSDVVRFSKAYDTLTFTYRSFQDRERGSKSMASLAFSLLTTPQGEKVLYGYLIPYFDDGVVIMDSTDYSLNGNVVIPGGLPKGKYKIVLRIQVSCFCAPHPSDFYSQEFTLE